MTFDTLASTYDVDFTETAIGRHLRARVQQRLLALFQPGQHILELGCGTGEDARYLAEHGRRVTATDSSPIMRQMAQSKTAHLPSVDVAALDLAHLPGEQSSFANQTYDGAFANFGVLNCLHDWRPLAEWLKGRLPVGAAFTCAVMPPGCIWELIWHAAHGNLRTATRRWRTAYFEVGGHHQEINYPSPRRLRHVFAPYFRMQHLEPLGLFLPPSDIYGVIERRPGLLQRLTRLDDTLGRGSALANLGDHYWIEFVRV